MSLISAPSTSTCSPECGLARGKHKMQALVAVMRKLLHAIYGMFKHDQAFDGSKVYRLPEELTVPRSPFFTTEAA